MAVVTAEHARLKAECDERVRAEEAARAAALAATRGLKHDASDVKMKDGESLNASSAYVMLSERSTGIDHEKGDIEHTPEAFKACVSPHTALSCALGPPLYTSALHGQPGHSPAAQRQRGQIQYITANNGRTLPFYQK